jgi:hypothetical protein
MVELEDHRTILVIDGRVFTSEVAGEMLERFLTYLLNEATLKILLIQLAIRHVRKQSGLSQRKLSSTWDHLISSRRLCCLEIHARLSQRMAIPWSIR